MPSCDVWARKRSFGKSVLQKTVSLSMGSHSMNAITNAVLSLNSWVMLSLIGLIFFRYNVADFYPRRPTSGMEFRQPIWAPARVLINLNFWAFIFLVPILYWRIFKFRNTQVAVAGVHMSHIYKIEKFNDRLVCHVSSWKVLLKQTSISIKMPCQPVKYSFERG